jgi:hypothetical protein
MATVHIWGNTTITGHASVKVKDGFSDNTYLSFRPQDQSKLRLVDDLLGSPATLVNFGYDLHYETLAHEININWLNEDEMQSQIDLLKAQIVSNKLKYNLATSNCSTLAAQLLLIGAGDKLNSYKSIGQFWGEITSRSNNDGSMIECFRSISGTYLHCRNRGALSSFAEILCDVALTADLCAREFFWTPASVKVLAERLAHKNR